MCVQPCKRWAAVVEAPLAAVRAAAEDRQEQAGPEDAEEQGQGDHPSWDRDRALLDL